MSETSWSYLVGTLKRVLWIALVMLVAGLLVGGLLTMVLAARPAWIPPAK